MQLEFRRNVSRKNVKTNLGKGRIKVRNKKTMDKKWKTANYKIIEIIRQLLPSHFQDKNSGHLFIPIFPRNNIYATMKILQWYLNKLELWTSQILVEKI